MVNEATVKVRQRLTGPERRLSLLDVGFALAAEGGLDAVRLDAVAQRAGVSRPVVYDHFATRDALLLAMLQSRALHQATEVRDALVTATDLESAVRLGTEAYLDSVGRSGTVFRSLLAASGTSTGLDAGRRAARAGDETLGCIAPPLRRH